MNYPNVVSKLGLVEYPREQSFFRRITPTQLKASGTETSLQYFKKQAVLLFVRAFAGEEDANFDNYDVFLSYKDTHGDMMIIHTDDDLIAAMEENTDAGKIKILAQVREKPPTILAQVQAEPTTPNNVQSQGTQHTNETSSPAAVSNDPSTRSPDGNVHDGPLQIVVQGAGNPAVDGVYSRGERVGNAWRYSKPDLWNRPNCTFSILQWPVQSETRNWYICIVPDGQNPGTTADVDFYRAPVQDDCLGIPPKTGWLPRLNF